MITDNNGDTVPTEGVIASLRSDLSAATARLAAVEKESRSPYCPTCKACGEDGCCPPDRCKHLACFYGADYAKSYKELETDLAAAEASRDEMREALRDMLEYPKTPSIHERAAALVSRAESDAGEAVTFEEMAAMPGAVTRVAKNTAEDTVELDSTLIMDRYGTLTICNGKVHKPTRKQFRDISAALGIKDN